jgi:hypothetical protein
VEGLEQRAMMTVFGNFEVDGDLVVNEGAADWASVGKVAIAYDLYNFASDPSFGSRVKEDTINPSAALGAIPANMSALTRL